VRRNGKTLWLMHSARSPPNRNAAPLPVKIACSNVQCGSFFHRTPGSATYRILFVIYEARDEAPFVFVLHIRHASRGPMTRREAREIESEKLFWHDR
jgi:hypothetical protein